MAERDVPIIQDTERVWVFVILLGLLWLCPAVGGHVWILLGTATALALLFVFPFGQDLLRRPAGFLATMMVLLAAVVFEWSRVGISAGLESFSELDEILGLFVRIAGIQSEIHLRSLDDTFWAAVEGMGEQIDWTTASVLVVVTLAAGSLLVAGARVLVRLASGRMELSGASFDLAARGLLIPLVGCTAVWIWAGNGAGNFLGIPTRLAALLLFLFHFHAFWPRTRWLSRWLCLIVIGSMVPLGPTLSAMDVIGGGLYGGSGIPQVTGPPFFAVPLTVVAFLRLLWDFIRVLYFIHDPFVRTFFFGGSLDSLIYGQAGYRYELLVGLYVFPVAGMSLGPVIALALPLLVALRLVRGDVRGRPWAYGLGCLALAVAMSPLWSCLVDPLLYRPAFLGETGFLWLTQGLPLTAVLAAAAVASLSLASAMSGARSSGHPTHVAWSEPFDGDETLLPKEVTRRLQRVFRALTSEALWLPLLSAILILGGLLGAATYLVWNRYLGTFPGVRDPRPGQTAAAPVLAPYFTKGVSPRIGLAHLGRADLRTIRKRFDPNDYAFYYGYVRPSRYFKGPLLPDQAACDRLTSETLRPDVRPYLEAFEQAAEADVCGWRVLTAANHPAVVDSWNLRETSRMISARASVAMAKGRWDAARQDISRLFRMGALIGAEGNYAQRMSNIRRYGVRCVFGMLRVSPDDQVRPLLEQLRSLSPWMQPLVTFHTFEDVLPGIAWHTRFVARLEIHGVTLQFENHVVADQGEVANFRLELMACATRAYLVETKRLPTTMDDLRPLLGGPPPKDPFTGKDFEAEFSAQRVRFAIAQNALPAWFDAGPLICRVSGKDLLAICVNAKGEVSVE